MAICACSAKSEGAVSALNNVDCRYQGLRLLAVAAVLYLLSGVVSAHLAEIQMLSMLAWAHITQPGAGVAVQGLQSLAAISALASTIQALVSAVPSISNLLKSRSTEHGSLPTVVLAGRSEAPVQLKKLLQPKQPTISTGNLRNVLIVLACGILIGSLSQRIGEALMFIYSLRSAISSACNHLAGSATECDTSKRVKQVSANEQSGESAEGYLVRSLCR